MISAKNLIFSSSWHNQLIVQMAYMALIRFIEAGIEILNSVAAWQM